MAGSVLSPWQDLKRVICCGTAASDTRRLAALDGVRCFALLWVFALHSFRSEFVNVYTGEQLADPRLRKGVLLQWWSQPALQGNTGVDAFFVLSGMLISSTYLQKDVERLPRLLHAALFCLRRFFRIWPMVVAAVGTAFLMAASSPDFALHWRSGLAWPYLILMPNFFPNSLGITGIGHLWCVSVEMQMYLLTPLLCELIFNVSAGRRRRGAFALLGGLSLLSLGLRAWWVFGPPQMMDEPWWPPPPLYTNVFARISPYLSGMALHLALQECETQDATMQKVVCAALADGLSIVSLLLSGLVGHHYFPAPSFMGELLPDSVEKLVVVSWPPLFGWCLARCLYRILTAQAPKKDAGLWGHFVPWYWCQQFLGASCFFRLALLSYSAYVMQFVAPLPLTFIDNRLDLSWAGLAPQDRLGAMLRAPVQFVLWTTLSCVIALPYHAVSRHRE
mmetsp:Transcript_73560/g.172555  ORF Transcript_73560/g.172555 Transcript_73560/m.172555 type:complete len:448 (-) Transcript_73560:574-1917(-)